MKTSFKQKLGDGKGRQRVFFSSLLRATYSVLGLDEGIVDSNDLDVGVLDRVAEHDAADATEPVDADLGDHFDWCGDELSDVSWEGRYFCL